MKRLLLGLLIATSAFCGSTNGPALTRLDIGARFVASGYMGDDGISIDPAWRIAPHSGPVCFKVTYVPGPREFGGVYWMNRPKNWCVHPGEDFSATGYTKLTFWAKGERGREIVEFKAGGISCQGQPHHDSFEASLGHIPLTDDWHMYTIDLRGQDLSSVIGGFCWVAAAASNPEGITFYLDDIYYEGE